MDLYRLYGSLGSPFSMKIRAVMRYRRLPFIWTQMGGKKKSEAIFAKAKAPVIPVLELLKLAGEVYFPFLVANAKAFEKNEAIFCMNVLGKPYSRGVFKYQVKCLAELRRAYAALSSIRWQENLVFCAFYSPKPEPGACGTRRMRFSIAMGRSRGRDLNASNCLRSGQMEPER